jgi:hypothetical protein
MCPNDILIVLKGRPRKGLKCDGNGAAVYTTEAGDSFGDILLEITRASNAVELCGASGITSVYCIKDDNMTL